MIKPRKEIAYYAGLQAIISQKKYKQKVIKLEEVIDEVYLNETYPYKMLIQTKPKFGNMVDDFLRLRDILVIYFLIYFNHLIVQAFTVHYFLSYMHFDYERAICMKKVTDLLQQKMY